MVQTEAQKIYDDIVEERGQEEIQGMSKDDALETVKCYGHEGETAQEIANFLWSMAEGV
jgi:hypothetical protein